MPRKDAKNYHSHRAAMGELSRERSLVSRDIGDIPPVDNSDRKRRSLGDFRFFCEQYFPLKFSLAWSPDHLKVIRKVELAVLQGDLCAIAMPRGSGKTTICEVACIWALLTGLHHYVLLIGSSEAHAYMMFENIKTEMGTNKRLLADFPEVLYPIHCLEGQSRRCAGQLHHGEPTRIGWGETEVILPAIPGSIASGGLLRVAGLTGNIRGANHTLPSGKSVRPSLVLLDDPQTDESARSPAQCATRESIISGAILGLAGPGAKIAGLMTLTVVRPNDMADRVLDRHKHPEWQGERTKLLYVFPTNEKLWEEYARLRGEGRRCDRGTQEADAYYLANRAAMDAGAVVAWEARYGEGEVSALQHAMNLRIDRGDAAFFAEYQNEPLPEEAGITLIDAATLCAKTNGLRAGDVPLAATRLTAFIDVSATLLWWMVCAWEEDFTGYVVDYGATPDQHRNYYTLRDAKITLPTRYPGQGQEATIYSGLTELSDKLLGREYRRDDGAAMRIERMLVDANWGQSTDVVYQFCRQSPHAARIYPSHGRFVGASSVPFGEYKPKPGERAGLHWRIPQAANQRGLRYVLMDTNFWKSFIHARLAVPMGDPGCLSLFAMRNHQMLADQLTAEYPVHTTAKDRNVDEWKGFPDRDNHWLDCLVGCAVAASILGSMLPNIGGERYVAKPRRRLSEWQQR